MNIPMKIPLLIAAGLIVVRILLEELILGAASPINNLFGVAWLYFLVPIYFAIRIRQTQTPRPFVAVLKHSIVFAFYTRLMVMVTYWLAYAFEWSAPRFAVSNGGVVGSGSNMVFGEFPNGMPVLYGIVLVPLLNIVFWLIFASVIGALTGGLALLVLRNMKNR